MVTFFVALAILIGGYFVYGSLVEKVFKPTDNPTPAVANPDGVDYVPIPAAKAFLIQLLNIAGLGPIFGAISGAMWGPSVYIWIVLGTLLAGAVHDFTAGMLSERNDGASISEVTGKYLDQSCTMSCACSRSSFLFWSVLSSWSALPVFLSRLPRLM